MPNKAPQIHGKVSARAIASKILLEVEADGDADSGEVLRNALDNAALDPREARLATSLVFNVLRNQLLLDYQYRPFLTLAPSRLSPETRCLLRLVAAQKLFFDRLPDHAIVNECVEMARKVLRRPKREIAFLNAVARKIVGAIATLMPPASLPQAEQYSIIYSFPAWLVQLLLKKYGAEAAIQIMAAQNQEPATALRVNTLAVSAATLSAELAAEGIETVASGLIPDALILRQTGQTIDLLTTKAFTEGRFYIQDEASQMVAHLAAPQPGEKVLDLCSAPGGKATHLAELSGGNASVVATDISPQRLGKVRENISRLRTPNIQTAPYEEITRQPAAFDCVLVDAPCSGLGTLRRNPEIRYRCSNATIERLAGDQAQLLNLAATLLRPGGRIVYSTCTISDTENASVIATFLSQHRDLTITSNTASAFKAEKCSDGFHRTWPTLPQMDGFEAVILSPRP